MKLATWKHWFDLERPQRSSSAGNLLLRSWGGRVQWSGPLFGDPIFGEFWTWARTILSFGVSHQYVINQLMIIDVQERISMFIMLYGDDMLKSPNIIISSCSSPVLLPCLCVPWTEGATACDRCDPNRGARKSCEAGLLKLIPIGYWSTEVPFFAAWKILLGSGGFHQWGYPN